MKTELPGNAKIAKDAKESIQECVSEFISFITSEASDKCLQEKRKTINGDDLLWAMSTLGFDKYIDPLKLYLSKYRDSVKGEKPEKKPSAASMRKGDQGGSGSGAGSSSSSNQHHGGSAVGTLGTGLSLTGGGNMGMAMGLGNSNNNSNNNNTMNMTMNLGMNMGMNAGGLSASNSSMHGISHPHSNNSASGDNLMSSGMSMLPSVSNIPGYAPYDSGSSGNNASGSNIHSNNNSGGMNNTHNGSGVNGGGPLLMSGGIEASPLFLNNNGGKIGDALLPPLPKKRDLGGADMAAFPPSGGMGAGNNMPSMNALNKKHKTT